MIPLDDWLILKLWEPQMASIEASLVLPDSVEKEKSEAAVFEILAKGPEATKVKVGQIVALGFAAVGKMKKPNGEYVLVGKASDVFFIMEKSDLERGER